MIKLNQNRVLIEKNPPVEGKYFTEPTDTFTGKIKFVGPDVKNHKVDDEVMYEKFDHSEVVIKDVLYVLCKENTIICTITD